MQGPVFVQPIFWNFVLDVFTQSPQNPTTEFFVRRMCYWTQCPKCQVNKLKLIGRCSQIVLSSFAGIWSLPLIGQLFFLVVVLT